jgi:hypothetical protein
MLESQQRLFQKRLFGAEAASFGSEFGGRGKLVACSCGGDERQRGAYLSTPT